MVERLAWTVPEAAESIGVHPNTIRNLIRAGKLRATHVGTGKRDLRISRKALEAYLDGGEGDYDEERQRPYVHERDVDPQVIDLIKRQMTEERMDERPVYRTKRRAQKG